ncbi:MAG: hypothetical protein J6S56_03800 [Bacteroidales bacterium]|nr:hypothetical protein [Bacteroidales bacterium]
MKKLLFLVCAIFFATTAFAQKITVLGPDVAGENLAYLLNTHRCEKADGTRYLYSASIEKGKKKTEIDKIFTIEDGRVTATTLTHPESVNFLKCYDNEDGLAAFYIDRNNKEKVYTLYGNKISPTGGSAPWNPDEILSFTFEKQDNLMIATAISPDKSKNLVAFVQLQRKGSYKGNVVCVFDNSGDLLWQNTLDFDFKSDYFNIIDMAVNNEGVAFAGVYAFDAPNNHTRTNEVLYMYEITESNSSSVSEPLDFHISNGKMMTGKSGNVIMGGYYKKDLKKNENGSYIVVYDPKSSNFKSISHKDFPGDYHEKATGGIPAGYCPNQDHYITAEGLYACSDGSVILLGEQKTMRSVTTQAGNMQITTYYYFARGVVYDKTDSNGEITQSKIFEKRQMAAAGASGFSYKRMGVSYYPFFENDKLYILYADNSANYAGKSNMVYKNTAAGKKMYCCTMLTIDENGKGETTKLMDLKTAKRMITTPLFKTDDGFIVVENMKKTVNISHLSANF